MLHVPIFENNNLYECIEKYQDTEKLEGDNQWHNEKSYVSRCYQTHKNRVLSLTINYFS